MINHVTKQQNWHKTQKRHDVITQQGDGGYHSVRREGEGEKGVKGGLREVEKGKKKKKKQKNNEKKKMRRKQKKKQKKKKKKNKKKE